MLLVADIGNTETTIGLFDGERLVGQWRVMSGVPRTPDEIALLLRQLLATHGTAPATVTGVAIGSVVPGLTPSFTAACGIAVNITARVIDASSRLPVHLDVDAPTEVGADRIVNTLAASRLWRRDAIVVDFGTATTFDCVTADGAFIGGVIAPGALTSAETLFRRAARLSATELVPPRAAIGRKTDEAIRSGVVLGHAEMVDGIVRRLKAEWPSDAIPYVVATGGLAEHISPICSQIELVVPELTLIGLRLAWEAMG